MELTEQVRQYIVTRILDGTYGPGDSIPTERDMTKMTATSRVTVRRAYAQLEKAGIIVRRQKTGSRVAETFRGNSGKLDSIAVISSLRDSFARDFLEEIQRFCNENDILTILGIAETPKQQEEAALRFAAKGVRNLIFWGLDRSLDFSVFARIRVLGVNIVFFDRVVPEAFADYVGLDNQRAISDIVGNAGKQQCDAIGFVNYSGLEIDSDLERQEAFEQLCRKAKIDYKVFYVPWEATISQYPQKQIAESFAKSKKPALVGVNDRVAIGLKKIFPDHFDIYGIDGTPEAISAGITTYSQPVKAMASATIDGLARQRKLGNRWIAKEYRFTGQLKSK